MAIAKVLESRMPIVTKALPAADLLSADDILPSLIDWTRIGLKCSVVTLVGIDGAAPRPVGAQMLVAEDGRYTGYLSGGCLEEAVALEAIRIMGCGANKLVRYGRGSPYFDLKLPCGSGLDIYFDQSIAPELIQESYHLRTKREAFVWLTNLSKGITVLQQNSLEPLPESGRAGDIFRRAFIPEPRVLLVGGGPMLSAIAQLLDTAGYKLECVSPDERARNDLDVLGISCRSLRSSDEALADKLDQFSAAIVAFHEHDWEPPILRQILETQCFYIGVLGSKTAHAKRLAKLTELGLSAAALERIRGPVGLIPNAKSRAALAIGVLAELTATAKSSGLLA